MAGTSAGFGTGAMVPEFETAALPWKNPVTSPPNLFKAVLAITSSSWSQKQDRPLTADQYQAAKDKVFSDWLTAAKEEYGVEIFDIWQQRVPAEPNFITQATEAANDQMTAQAEGKIRMKAQRMKDEYHKVEGFMKPA